MCVSIKSPSPPPAPEPVPIPTNTVSNATTKQVAPTSATGEASGRHFCCFKSSKKTSW